jgi:hypothetical protein
VMTFDAKGVVMRPEELRKATARNAASRKLSTRLSRVSREGMSRSVHDFRSETGSYRCWSAVRQ